MKKSLVFILAVLFFAINFMANSQEKIFDLKDKYYNCGSRDFREEFKIIGENIELFQFLVEPESATNGAGYYQISSNLYALKLDEINSSCKIIFFNNYRYDSLTNNMIYDEIQSFDVIKLDTLPKPTILQVGNKLVSNIEGPHRWYLGASYTNRFEDTPNNEYIPKMQGTYQAVVINPDYECVSAESNKINYMINSLEEEIKYSNSQKYNINENTITFFEVDWVSVKVEINSVEIFNILGEKIESNLNNINYTNNSISIQFDNNFKSLNAGLYLVIMKDNKNTLHKFTFVK